MVHALSRLSDQKLAAVIASMDRVEELANQVLLEEAKNTYVVPLDDKDVPKQLDRSCSKWRKFAADCGYYGPVVWKVRAGFTLKNHAPLAGPCFLNLDYIQDWELRNDEPTKDGYVFWVPRIVEGSTEQSVSNMETIRAKHRDLYELPESHAVSFGSVGLLFALILAHFKRTGERVPLRFWGAASDSFDEGSGVRLAVGSFDEDGLRTESDWDEDDSGFVGFFMLGVEPV